MNDDVQRSAGATGRARPAYQLEPSDAIRTAAFQRGHLTPLELFRIGAWKSAMGLASMTLNDEAAIVEHTRTAVAAVLPWRGVDVLAADLDWEEWESAAGTAIGWKDGGTALLGLKGVEYPMASAIVSYLVREAFPVLDRWTVLAIFGAPSVSVRYRRKAAYRQFTQRLIELQSHYPEAKTVHAVDQAVMNAAIARDRDPRRTLPFEPIELLS